MSMVDNQNLSIPSDTKLSVMAARWIKIEWQEGDSMTTSKRLLFVAGCLSLLIAVFQAVVSFSPEWSLYFGAPTEIVNTPWLLLVSGEIAAVFFVLFGLYGLSGAGRIKRLFLLRLGLVVISAIYVLRGLMIILELLIIWDILPSYEVVTSQGLISSVISLAIGLIYSFGTIGAWRELNQK
jgi:putative oxidoreductase